MAKRIIGIDMGPEFLRVVTATLEKGTPVLTDAREQRLETLEEQAGVLSAMLGEVSFNDRVVVSLPAVGSFFRVLDFPFGEAKKLEPAVQLEMSSQVPSSGELVSDFLSPRAVDRGFEVPAAAVGRNSVTYLLDIFGRAGKPLHVLDLNPFAYAAGLAASVPEGVLAVVSASEVTVSEIRAGQVVSYRTQPLDPQDDAERLAAMIGRDYLALAKNAEANGLPLYLMGEGATERLFHSLRESGFEPRLPALAIAGRQVSASLLPAAALALRGAQSGRVRWFNFLKGDLAPKSEWAGLRLRLATVAALTGLAVILTLSGAYLNYMQKQRQAETLRQETMAIFRQTFPQVKVIVDVPSQMRSSLDELRDKARLLGLGQGRSALNVLREVSARIPREIDFEARELSYGDNDLRIDGTTSSFDSINRLAQALEASPLFEHCEIADAKTGLDNGRVDFRLNVKITAEGSLQ